MKEKPILFNAEMVRAILEGRKTQTRRIVKGIGKNGKQYWTDLIQDTEIINNKEISLGFEDENGDWHKTESACPYGQIGDRLWVRETFNTDWCDNVIYKADGGSAIDAGYSKEPKWKPSIFMNRKYSRINLEITNIRVERVQEISEEDAKAEGIELSCALYGYPCYKKTFHELWDSINKKRGYSWDSNPWVWVVEFKRQK